MSRIDIVRAIRTGEPHQTLPFVRPGGEILLRADGWPKVERVLQAIDAVEALDVDPADVAPDHWRHDHNRLTAGTEPRAYTSQRHEAWLKLRRAGPSPACAGHAAPCLPACCPGAGPRFTHHP